MNRKERRATLKHGPPGAVRAADGASSQINKLFLDSLALESAGKLDEAARAYKRSSRSTPITPRRTTISRAFCTRRARRKMLPRRTRAHSR